MAVYYSDHAIVKVDNSSAGVHQLPFGTVVVTGVTATAAAGGTKNLSGILRCSQKTILAAGLVYRLSASPQVKQTGLLKDLHIGPVRLDGITRVRQRAPRFELFTLPVATKTFYFKNTASSVHRSLQDGGTPPATAVTGTGWTVAKLASGQYSEQFSNVKRASTTFSVATLPASNGTASTVDTTNGDCWRTENPLSGSFANTNWVFTFQFQSVAVAASGTIRVSFRVLKSANANGSGAVDVTGTNNNILSAVAGPLLIGTSTASAVTTTLGAVTLNNEYLFIQCALLVFSASGNNSADAVFAVGSTAGITTPLFTPTYQYPVWVDGSMAAKQTLTGTLTTSAASKFLDGALSIHQTLTGDVDRRPGVFMDGILHNVISMPNSDIFIAGRIGAKLRNRSVGNLAVLTTGTTHHPTALLQNKVTLSGQLTLNYMQALLQAGKWRANCNLFVNVKLAGSSAVRQTATLALTDLRAFAASASMHQMLTGRLTMPLRGVLQNRVSAGAVPTVRRQIAATVIMHQTATLTPYVGRYLSASVGLRQTPAGTLDIRRLLAASLSTRQSLVGALTAPHLLAGFLFMRQTARMALSVVNPAHAPTTEITVTPDMVAFEEITSFVVVDSPHTEAHVE